MSVARFVVLKDKAGGFRFRLVARNNRIIAVGESHTREADAWRAARTVAETAPIARRWSHETVAPSKGGKR